MTLPAGYKQIPVKTWFLIFEGSLPDISSFGGSVRMEQWEKPSAAEYLEIYKAVGSVWGWTGRLLKTSEELTEILNSANNEVWLFRIENEVTGFFELVRAEGETEIVYLGLKPEWIGKGLGQKLIQASVYVAGQNGEKVWLHTCERDHESALMAYQKAGFKIEKELISLEYYPE
jgi:ribosomal protein S18 acetylase RimI-like enzyme